ncbi:hypothetical protein [Comamonas terrae]|uniref:Phage protein n=1 Tax=Comamonas terrae TaxID=673548 RepID=A0ABW5UQG3_9BURK|nr:hypothetical protein [Comamonas terrae]
MSVQIEIDDVVRVPVEGQLINKDGQRVDFSFDVDMHRMPQEEFDRELKNLQIDTFSLVVREARGWNGVLNREGDQVPFSGESLKRFLRIPGMTNMIWVAYCMHAGVQAKNSERSSA